ncbi:MAG: OmpH family outer membrane protein [Candidatus Sulfopaludibacter sp.]|nr:OmpH family outer membrane protein [Candidatus Sulfopaludibacter sp.]
MKLHQLFVCAWALAGLGVAQTAAPNLKIALVNMQDAVAGTADGKNAEKQLDDEFAPRKANLDAQEKEIAGLQAKMDAGGLTADAKEELGLEIDHKTLLFNIATQDADGDLRTAQKKVLRNLGSKMIACIAQYAKAKGYTMVFDISDSEVPKLYPNATDITQEVIAEYEKGNQSVKSKTSK